MTDLFGFSIDAIGPMRMSQVQGKKVKTPQIFSKINSVDLIVEPGAGGGIINFKEAKDINMSDPTKTEEPKESEKIEDVIDKKIDEKEQSLIDKISARVLEEMNKNKEEKAPETVKEAKDAIKEAMKIVEAKFIATSLVDKNNLPEKAKERLKEAISKEQKYISSFDDSGKVNLKITKDQSDKNTEFKALCINSLKVNVK